MPEAITPTRIIPAGQPLPARPTPAAPPPPPRQPPTPPAAPPLPPNPPQHVPGAPLVVHHVHEHHLVHVVPAPPVPVRRSWTWLTSRFRPVLTALAGVVALAPWDHGVSPVGGWSLTLHQARAVGIGAAYVLAAFGLGFAVLVDLAGHHNRTKWGPIHRAAGRGLLIITLIGGTGVLNLYDPVTLITGVRP